MSRFIIIIRRMARRSSTSCSSPLSSCSPVRRILSSPPPNNTTCMVSTETGVEIRRGGRTSPLRFDQYRLIDHEYDGMGESNSPLRASAPNSPLRASAPNSPLRALALTPMKKPTSRQQQSWFELNAVRLDISMETTQHISDRATGLHTVVSGFRIHINDWC